MNHLVGCGLLVWAVCLLSQQVEAKCESKNALIEKGAPGCLPKRETVFVDPIEGAEGLSISGMYMKTHPSGDYVIVSNPTGVIDLSRRGECGEISARFIKSPMNAEAAPVEGKNGWALLASPNHEDGMRYYRFDEILTSTANAQADFQDIDHNQFYQSASEMEGSSENKIKFRTVLYSGGRYRDYQAVKGTDGKFKVTKSSEPGNLCMRIVDPKAKKKPSASELKKQKQQMDRYNEILEGMREIEQRLVNSPQEDQEGLTDAYGELLAESESMQASGFVGQVHNPVLSKDGKEMSFLSEKGDNLKIARIINSTDCEITHDLGYQAGKGSFSRPKGGKKGIYVFPASYTDVDASTNEKRTVNGVYVLDKDSGKVTKVADGKGQYPGITDDGRIVYMQVDSDKRRSLKIVDLNQLEGGDISKCAKANTVTTKSSGGRK